MSTLVSFAVSRLAQFVRREVADAVAEAVEQGLVEGFARAGLELDARPQVEVVRATVTAASPQEQRPTFPNVKPTDLTAPPKRKRGRPRKQAQASEDSNP